MTPEQLIALLALMADLHSQIAALAAENLALRARLAEVGAHDPDSPVVQRAVDVPPMSCSDVHPGQDVHHPQGH